MNIRRILRKIDLVNHYAEIKSINENGDFFTLKADFINSKLKPFAAIRKGKFSVRLRFESRRMSLMLIFDLDRERMDDIYLKNQDIICKKIDEIIGEDLMNRSEIFTFSPDFIIVNLYLAEKFDTFNVKTFANLMWESVNELYGELFKE